MEKAELQASLSLASIFALRMLGLFLILPVFSVHAKTISTADQLALVGLALGVYGLVQACLHIPLGMLSDRWGRRPLVILGLVLFVLGALIAAHKDNLVWITVGRAIQGAGAVSAVVTAWLADLTRDEVRSRAMAMIGGSIGLTFALSLVFAAPLYAWLGLDGLFYLMAFLGFIAIGVAAFVVPATPQMNKAQSSISFWGVLVHPALIRLNLGVLILHMTQMALFLTLPRQLSEMGWALADHWQIYLPALLISFVLMMPLIIWSERRRRFKPAFIFAILCMLIAQCAMAVLTSTVGVWISVVIYFIGFNVMEAMQPSLVSRYVPAARGTALGIYNTTQSIGLFLGGVLGGIIMQKAGEPWVFLTCAAFMVVWLIINSSMRELSAQHQTVY